MGVCTWNISVFVIQVILIVLFGLFVEYAPELQKEEQHEGIGRLYSMFQDVHVMIFIGFGFLMTFLKRYSYSSVGFNFLLAAIMIQWSTLCSGFFKMNDNGKIPISLNSILAAEVATATFLISFGVLIGKCSLEQYIFIGMIEIPIFAANEHVVYHILEVADVGGTIVVHVFGCYFGLAITLLLHRKYLKSEKTDASYTSDMTAMMGTVFLWIFWPSFNAAFASGAAMHRAIVNTYFSLATCTIATFATCSFMQPHRKIGMEYVQNSALAGGVAIGAAANMMIQPFGAMIVGGVAGIISCIGFHYITPWLYNTCRMHDTCGVHNLHGTPGILGALVSALVASLVDPKVYGSGLSSVFPAMGGHESTNLTMSLNQTDSITYHEPRTSSTQAMYQLAALAITIAVSIVGGLITGVFLNIPGIKYEPPIHMLYEDQPFWELPHECEEDANKSSNYNSETEKDSKI